MKTAHNLTPILAIALAIGAGVLLSGCSVTHKTGPKAVERSFGPYNEAVSDVLAEELLMNVVRRRYFEAPQYAAHGSISPRRGFNQDANFNTGISTSAVFAPANGSFNLSGTDTGTITITPQQGPEISENLHKQLELSSISRLANAGYPVSLILALVAQDVAHIRGVEFGAGDIRGGSPRYLDLLGIISSLEAKGDLTVADVVWEEPYFEHAIAPENFAPAEIVNAAGVRSTTGLESGFRSLDGGQTYYITSRAQQPALWVAPEARHSGPARELISLIGTEHLDPSKEFWRLKGVEFIQGSKPSDKASGQESFIPVRTRSFYGVLNLLSYAVEVPEEDAETVATQAQAYSEAVEKGLTPDIRAQLLISHSPNKPKNAFVAVKYRNGWFYIDERDLASKRVFNVVQDLYNLQVSPTSDRTTAPFFTLPVR